MKRVIIELPDDYSDVISVTVIGRIIGTTNIATAAFDINKGENISYDGTKWKQEKVGV